MRPSSLKKRKRYLDVATELFLEQGYEGTGLDQLIKQCGGSKLTLYSYFGDKKGLLKAVVTELTEQLWHAVNFETEDDQPLKVQLITFACRYLAFIYSPSLLKLTRLVITQSKNEPELVDYFLSRGIYYSQSVLQEFLVEQKALGTLQIDDVEMSCEQLLGALKGNRFIEALFTDIALSEQEINCYAEYAITAFLKNHQP